DALGNGRKAGSHDHRVGRALSEFHLAAVATLSHPLGQPEDKVEAELFGKHGATRIIIERPRCPSRRGRRAPSSRLKWQEQPKDQRVLRRVLDGSDMFTLGTLCRHVFHPAKSACEIELDISRSSVTRKTKKVQLRMFNTVD